MHKYLTRILAYCLMIVSPAAAMLSLLMFVVFVVYGPLNIISFNMERKTALLFNTGLCLLFFIQHSGMVRKTFKQYLAKLIHPAFHAALFSLMSGILLSTMIVLWQETSVLIALPVYAEIGMRIVFLTAAVFYLWSAGAMKGFEPYGIRDILCFIRRQDKRPVPFTIKGAYRWVRHPLYLSALMMIWSGPRLTEDRLLFNVLWTVWIITGAWLEERDLITVFGDQYLEYRQQTPMLIPCRRPYQPD